MKALTTWTLAHHFVSGWGKMHRLGLRNTFAVLAILCLIMVGCGGKVTDTPPLASVNGVVTLNGKPLTSGSVQLTPDSSKGTTGRMALGAIKEDGTFELMTMKPGDGAQVGHHLVAIECYEATAFDPNNPVNQEPKSLIPKRYTDPKTSGISVEVKANEDNSFSFELKTAP